MAISVAKITRITTSSTCVHGGGKRFCSKAISSGTWANLTNEAAKATARTVLSALESGSSTIVDKIVHHRRASDRVRCASDLASLRELASMSVPPLAGRSGATTGAVGTAEALAVDRVRVPATEMRRIAPAVVDGADMIDVESVRANNKKKRVCVHLYYPTDSHNHLSFLTSEPTDPSL